jgi:1-acyl-sn-glycerol-3-phosphate acyltransferase
MSLKSYLSSKRDFPMLVEQSEYCSDCQSSRTAVTQQCSIDPEYPQLEAIPTNSSTSIIPVSNPQFSLPSESKLMRLFATATDSLYQFWFDLECDGLENLPHDRPFLLAANHASHLDAGAVMAALRSQVNRISVLGAKDYFCNTPIREWFFRTFFNLIPCDRNRSLFADLRECRAVLAPANPVLIFPEGTRSLTGKLQPFQAGVGFLALKLKVPILPVLIEGTFEALPKEKLFPRRHPIRVKFGSLLDPLAMRTQLEAQSEREICQAIAAEIEQEIRHLGDR